MALLVIVGSNSVFAECVESGSGPTFEAGHADLSCWDGRSLALVADWKLHYKDRDSDRTYAGLTPVPGLWRNMPSEPALSPFGFGLYYLDITLPEQSLGQLGLFLPRFNSARRISVISQDNKKIVLWDSGAVNTLDSRAALMRSDAMALPDIGNQFRLQIEVSNTYGQNGGLVRAPVIAPLDFINEDLQQGKLVALILITVLIVFGLINLSLWMVKVEDWSRLLLATVSFLVASRNLATSYVLYDFFPLLTVYFDAIWGWVMFLAGTALGPSYFRVSYPRLIPRWQLFAPLSLSLIAFLLLAFTPLIVIQKFGDIYRPANAINAALITIYLAMGLRTGDAKLKITVFGLSLICAAFTFDIMRFHIYGSDTALSATSLAWVFFMVSQTVFMSTRYKRALDHAEEMAEKLVSLNAELESKVIERTSELEEKNKQLDALAHIDTLTKVANRRALEVCAHKELQRADRSGNSLVIALLDLDHFKKVNDRFGHAVGDEVLESTAQLLNRNLRAGDTIARWGGEEFCIIFPDTLKDTAHQVSLRLCEALNQQSFNSDSETFKVSASFGLSATKDKRPLEELIHEADQALYQAKHDGRNRVICFWNLLGH